MVFFTQPQNGGFLLAYMSKENDFYPQEELQRDLKALDAAYKDDSLGELFERSENVVDPEVMFVMTDFELSEDRYYHGLITACFPSIPNGPIEENAKKFIGRFGQMRNMMVESFRSSGDLGEAVESVTISGLDLAGASDFASFYNAESGMNYLSTPVNHELYRMQEKASKYWNELDEIIFCAYKMERASRDPDLDQTLKQ